MNIKYLILLSGLLAIFSAHADVAPPDWRQKQSDQAWEENIRVQNFQDRKIIEGPEQTIFELKVPQMAEDATVVPISVHTKISQTTKQYIKKMHIFVDKNPIPLVGLFEFTPDSGKADLAMRIRVDTHNYVRVIAELNNGELYMAKSFIKAKGACSAPPPPGSEESKKLLGKMRMKVVGDLVLGKPNLMQLKIRHPNITGMAPLKIGSRVRPPAHFVDSIEINYNGKLIVKASLTFSVSMDPALRFYFVPKEEGTLLVKGTDTKKNQFSGSHDISLDT
ncbi:MAG: quinoprotein dehydrogenase-associated SoxYZ-like carrier [Gammaproteobacteria bacterium]